MIEWIQANAVAINLLATITLVSVTAYYVYLTKRILHASDRQSKLNMAPVIGIKITGIHIGKVFSSDRRNMSVNLELTNVGNAPAIEVFVDAEIVLRYSNVKGHKSIPSRMEPEMVPFIKPGETVTECSPNFGNTLITHFFDDVRESSRLNLHRIETDPTQTSFRGSRLQIFVYYRNCLDQHFRSHYEADIDLFSRLDEDPIPKDNETKDVTLFYIPRPTFHSGPFDENDEKKEIETRDEKRKYSGW